MIRNGGSDTHNTGSNTIKSIEPARKRNANLKNKKMQKIRKYKGRRIKDGSLVTGYAAQGTECGLTFILIPASSNSFHTVEVDPETLSLQDDEEIQD